MKGSIGCPTKTVTHIPHMRYLANRTQGELSEKAKQRLAVIDFYHHKSAQFSKSGKPNVSLTCRHFGIHRSLFYKWYKRFNKHQLRTYP